MQQLVFERRIDEGAEGFGVVRAYLFVDVVVVVAGTVNLASEACYGAGAGERDGAILVLLNEVVEDALVALLGDGKVGTVEVAESYGLVEGKDEHR